LPLSQIGISVQGIDLSPDMVAQLKSKPGTNSIGVTIGDFATAKVNGSFRLVFLVFNTITNLTTQVAQVECFRNAAAHLEPGGCFVIETFIPELRRLPPGETILPQQFSQSRFDFDVYNVATQGLISHHYRNVDGAFQGHSLPFRYVWPSELDLMAQLAGMKLRERWSNWNRQPYTNESTAHISVWEKSLGRN
jgi:SAM-dependent methyltransferase